MALMKQLALGRDVRDPIISVVMVRTVVTPALDTNTHKLSLNIRKCFYFYELLKLSDCLTLASKC